MGRGGVECKPVDGAAQIWKGCSRARQPRHAHVGLLTHPVVHEAALCVGAGTGIPHAPVNAHAFTSPLQTTAEDANTCILRTQALSLQVCSSSAQPLNSATKVKWYGQRKTRFRAQLHHGAVCTAVESLLLNTSRDWNDGCALCDASDIASQRPYSAHFCLYHQKNVRGWGTRRRHNFEWFVQLKHYFGSTV